MPTIGGVAEWTGGAGVEHPGRTALGRAGFETASDVYERARPGYPDDGVAALAAQSAVGPGSRVLDVAAGTGKLTRQLLALGAVCVAVEPSASMRAVFRRVVPGAPVTAGTAEELPLATGSMDAVVVAQAFHWFDSPRALDDIARVLRPGGSLALIWNERDESDPVMAELVTISRWDRHQPYPLGMDFAPLIDASCRFGPVTRTRFPFVQVVDRTAFVEQVASRSYVQVLGETERAAFLSEVADFAARLPEPISLPYLTDLFTAAVAR
jgi:SAM-dependent methyltransferase